MPKTLKTRNLKWRNKYSGEEGFVKTVSKKNNCFYNTFEQLEAKKYTSDSVINKDLEFLNNIGETENNEFFLVDCT